MKQYKIYLSGPITGLTYNDAIGWTDYAKEKLAYNFADLDDFPGLKGQNVKYKTGIIGYKPLRGKQYLKDVGKLEAVIDKPSTMATNKAIFGRDHYDVESCDAMLVNLLGAQRVSIGTMFEMAWAAEYRRPTVLVMEKQGNLHHHAFVLEALTHWTDNLDEGIATIKSICLPD